MKLRSLILVLAATLALAAKPNPNVPVTTYVSDSNPSGASYSIQSDGQAGPVNGITGEYNNGYQNVASFLNANTYNSLPPGDWTLDLLSSSLRTMRLTLNSLNEIQPGQPGYTVPPNPPFLGTVSLQSRFAEYCTAIGLDIGTMNAVNQTIQCPAIFRFNWNSSIYYRVYITGSWSGFSSPETTFVQIQCNSLGADGYCNDWYMDPIPVVNADGTTSPGQAIGRLVGITTRGTGTSTNEGDFYMTFHVHVTRP
ncbi:MAG: hypothetical protein ACM3WP_05490 [Acidobacteriota bacterium]